MFTNITWLQYSVFVLVSLIVYYLYVGLKFYLEEFKLILSGQIKSYKHNASENDNLNSKSVIASTAIQQELFDTENGYRPGTQETDDTVQKIEELTTNIKIIIAEAASKNYVKEEFVLSLQILLNKYQYLKGSPFIVAINNLIASECEKYRYIKLNAEERVMLWNE